MEREDKMHFKEYVLFQAMPTFINWKHTTTVKRILQRWRFKKDNQLKMLKMKTRRKFNIKTFVGFSWT